METFRRRALRACREFGYGRETYEKIVNATSEAEIERALVTARQNHEFSDEMKYLLRKEETPVQKCMGVIFSPCTIFLSAYP